ncbi:unnamed protein product [Scytosiphon promiscuus]
MNSVTREEVRALRREQDDEQRSGRKRRTILSLISSSDQHNFPVQNGSRVLQLYFFFADFWQSTPHPFGQLSFLLLSATLVATLNDDRVLDAGLSLDSNAGRSMYTILSFLIVFRTNQSYSRWWEGRVLWGKMHWSCVEVAQQAAVWIVNKKLARRITEMAIVYAYTVKQILRREHLFAEDLDGILDAAEVDQINELPFAMKPYYCTEVMRQCMKKGLTEDPQKFGQNAVARGIEIPVSRLSVQFADMARVRNTPQPDCFRVLLHMFTLLYLLLLPLLSYDTLGYLVIPEVFLTAYLMLGLQIAADDLEDPFGRDQSDLELDLFVANIASQCLDAHHLGVKSRRDLTTDGGGTRTGEAGGFPGGNGGSDPLACTRAMWGDGPQSRMPAAQGVVPGGISSSELAPSAVIASSARDFSFADGGRAQGDTAPGRRDAPNPGRGNHPLVEVEEGQRAS